MTRPAASSASHLATWRPVFARRCARPDRQPAYTLTTMARELPMFSPAGDAAHPHGGGLPESIALGGGPLGGGPLGSVAGDGTLPLRRHPDWIRARIPSGENYHELKG